MVAVALIAGAAVYLQSGFAQQPAAAVKSKRANDPRVQQKSYLFAFLPPSQMAHADLPYAVFVSSKVRKDKPAPLIVALHGLGGDPNTLMRGNLLDLAEAGGYVVVAPAGYNPRGWYGIPWTIAPQPGAAPKAADPAAINDPPNLTELAEKDVIDLTELAFRNYNLDEKRTYLMGHSMGGAGALYLGSKYAWPWAAVAALAPAARRMESHMDEVLSKLTMPVLVVQGDADTAVPVEGTRKWIAAMKERKMDHKYVEIPGADHGSVIAMGMPDVFAFFAAHSR